MNNYHRWCLSFFSGGLLVLLAVIWANFAPLSLGGQAGYVIVNGNSMEPAYHLGDLVIIRPALVYAVGEVVAYRDAALNRYVIHRIIGENLDRYILKGDHNTWIDSYQPTAGEILGTEWIHLPRLGQAIMWLRTPIILTTIVSALGATFMVSLTIRPKGNRIGQRKRR
jgi:signal peptidase